MIKDAVCEGQTLAPASATNSHGSQAQSRYDREHAAVSKLCETNEGKSLASRKTVYGAVKIFLFNFDVNKFKGLKVMAL